MTRIWQTLGVLLFAFSFAQAQQPEAASKPKFTPVNSQSAIRINYGYPAWNKNPQAIDSASMLMREGVSGRLVQIHLIETEPDSSVFSGLYSITWQDIEQLKIEFFVPPQDLLESADGLRKLGVMIAQGKLRKNPFILRKTATGSQTIEVFDTREQAQAAMRAYRAEQQLQGTENKKYPSDAQMEMAKTAEALREKAAAATADAERIRMEQVEEAKLAALKAQEAALSAAEKERRQKESSALAAAALALYKQSQFIDAVEKFSKAVDLDPDNHSHYFQFGVSLYKSEQYNKSLIYLNLSAGPGVDETEKQFFTGLDHFRLKEYGNALEDFGKVAAAKHPEMSPAATFYRGVIQFENRAWEPARAEFQSVLDTSKDAQLDQRSEAYLEQILRIQQFEHEKSQKWLISATLGEQYDSNVLLISDSNLSQGTATNNSGFRSLFTGSARYRPLYEETREFAVSLEALSMYTRDGSFNYSPDQRNADPTVATLTLPWTYKGLAFGKGYKFDITPGYEGIWMSIDQNSNKEIIEAYILNFSNLFVMNSSLYSNYNLELRREKSYLISSVGDDDASTFRVKVLNSNLHFLTEDKLRILTSEAALTLNQAQGKNQNYDRIDLAVGYIRPFYWDTTATAKIGYYWLNYPSADRNDHDVTLTLGASKKLSEIYSTGLVANYNGNFSNSDANTYKKWTALVTFSALYGH